jgi:hypothetical protein
MYDRLQQCSGAIPVRKLIISAAAVATAFGFFPGAPELLVTPAEAVVGRPLSPVSVAGVARRTTRRAVVYHSATTPTVVVATPPAGTTTCVTKYDAYGNKIVTCS